MAASSRICGKILLLDGDDHALLALADENLPALHLVDFQRRVLQPDLAAGLAEHFARGAAESARTAVGDELDQSLVARREDEVGDLFLLDRVSDLDGGLVLLVAARWSG